MKIFGTQDEAIQGLCEVNVEENKFMIEFVKGKFKIVEKRKIEGKIKEKLDYTYLETDGSRGIKAKVIYGDTDSIYTEFTLKNMDKMTKEEKLNKIWDVASECADRISETFQDPIELENEKTMWPLYLYGKKRYANLYYEKQRDGTFSCKKDFKGIQVVRRDNCEYVKSVCNPIFDKLLYDQDIDGAKDIARKMIKDLLDNKVEIEELVLSKSLKSKYKDTNVKGNKLSKPAHWFLAKKMKERDPGTAPLPGSRVQYLFVENKDKNALQADRVEDPEYAKEHSKECKPDVMYYLDKQLASPLYTIFEVIILDPKTGKVFPKKIKNDGKEETSKDCKTEIERLLWKRIKQDKLNELDGNQDITKWFTPAKKKTIDEDL
jgi:DNA polymerase elongation subunit (family B)